jgi:hypothetical protein
MMCLEDTASAIRKEVDKLRDAITNKNWIIQIDLHA